MTTTTLYLEEDYVLDPKTVAQPAGGGGVGEVADRPEKEGKLMER